MPINHQGFGFSWADAKGSKRKDDYQDTIPTAPPPIPLSNQRTGAPNTPLRLPQASQSSQSASEQARSANSAPSYRFGAERVTAPRKAAGESGSDEAAWETTEHQVSRSQPASTQHPNPTQGRTSLDESFSHLHQPGLGSRSGDSKHEVREEQVNPGIELDEDGRMIVQPNSIDQSTLSEVTGSTRSHQYHSLQSIDSCPTDPFARSSIEGHGGQRQLPRSQTLSHPVRDYDTSLGNRRFSSTQPAFNPPATSSYLQATRSVSSSRPSHLHDAPVLGTFGAARANSEQALPEPTPHDPVTETIRQAQLLRRPGKDLNSSSVADGPDLEIAPPAFSGQTLLKTLSNVRPDQLTPSRRNLPEQHRQSSSIPQPHLRDFPERPKDRSVDQRSSRLLPNRSAVVEASPTRINFVASTDTTRHTHDHERSRSLPRGRSISLSHVHMEDSSDILGLEGSEKSIGKIVGYMEKKLSRLVSTSFAI